jgi:hypothetical protein
MDLITKQVLSMDGGPSLIDFQHCVRLQEDWHLSSPGTSTEETGFSIIGWEKNDFQTSLTNFSLEGILHSKQYDH